VNVHQEVGPVDDLVGDRVRDALGHRAIGFAGVYPVQILAIDRAVVDRAAEEGRHVGDMHDEHRAAQCGGIECAAHSLQRHDRCDFGTMGARNQGERRPGLRATHDRNRNSGGGIGAGRDVDEPRCGLPGTCDGGSNR
jgi:hypothetical protein